MLMSVIVLLIVLSVLPFAMYFANAALFRRPIATPDSTPSISVLIPARNEESGIAHCLESVLANQNVDLEVIVLDDASIDRTAEIVRGIAARDSRVRLETAPPLPPGWAGKQHSCFALAKLATKPLLTFLDADVRLSDTALSRMAGFLQSSKAALVSGFPRQETKTFLEILIVPLINWLLLCYLPISQMRKSAQPGLGAGCGQWFMTTRDAYFQVGGHETIKNSFHDGIKLPRAYRAAGLMTDFCDATHDATCRMYHSAAQVWNGFAKNAREGMAGNIQIGIWTVLLSTAHFLPFVLLPLVEFDSLMIWCIPAACVMSLIPRFHAAIRFRQPLLGALLHPLAVLGLMGIQWYAAVRAWVGKPVGWKGRPLPPQGVTT